MKKCKICKKPMSIVKTVGKIRTVQVGHYCFKCKRIVPEKDKIKLDIEYL